MKLKLRSDSILASLTEAQLASLYDWILSTNCYADTQARAAQPLHEGGLGLNIQITTLRRFYSAYTNWLRAKEIADGERAATGSPDDLHTSAATEVAHSIHDLAHGPLNTSDLKLVAKYLQQQRDHALKTEYLKLAQHHANLATDKQTLARESHEEDKRRWEYNTAAAALTHHMKFNQVLNDPDLDEREKVWKAREICFGPDPNHPTPETLWTIPTHCDTHLISRSERPSMGNIIEARSESERHTSNVPTGSCNMEPDNLRPRSARTQIHAVQENSLEARRFAPPEELEPLALSHEPCPQLSPQSSDLSPELEPSSISHKPSAQGSAWSPRLEHQIPPIFNPEVTLFPTAKTASDWVNTARFPKEISRWFLVKLCEGSTDRFNALLACPEPFQIPVNSLRQLGEPHSQEGPR